MHISQCTLVKARNWIQKVVLATGLILISSTAGAVSIVTYDFTATLYPLGLNGGGTPPSTSSATGSFSYDRDQTPIEGYFYLTAFTFDPAADTNAGFFDCDPIGGCTGYGSIASVFNPGSKALQVSLLFGASYNVTHYFSNGQPSRYSDNDSYGTWGITSLTNRVPEPATLALLSLGLAGIAAVRRKKLAA